MYELASARSPLTSVFSRATHLKCCDCANLVQSNLEFDCAVKLQCFFGQ
uniref:Uncharacterized protein n=1 Tax=Arundo donax TaxID=35708 RepID=A0A0A9DI19_ARUDO